MSFINSSIAINGSLTPFNIGNNTSILPLHHTQAQDRLPRDRLPDDSLINSITSFSNKLPMNVENATNIFSSNRKIDRVAKVKIGNGFTDPKYSNIPRPKRKRDVDTFDDLSLFEKDTCKNDLYACEVEKHNITSTKNQEICRLRHDFARDLTDEKTTCQKEKEKNNLLKDQQYAVLEKIYVSLNNTYQNATKEIDKLQTEFKTGLATCKEEKHDIKSTKDKEIDHLTYSYRKNLEDERSKCTQIRLSGDQRYANLNDTYNDVRKKAAKLITENGNCIEQNQDLIKKNKVCNESLKEKESEIAQLQEQCNRLTRYRKSLENQKANLTTTYNITLEEKDREITQLNKQVNLTTTSLEEKDQELSRLNETLQHLEDEKNTCEANKANLTTTYNITLEEKDREITQLNNLTTTSLEEKDQELSRLNETLQHLEDEKNTCEAKRANLTTTYNITLEEKDREITQLNNLTTTSLGEKDQELSRLNETLQHLEDEKNTCEAKRANLTTTYNITLEEKDREITQLNNLTITSLEEKDQELSRLNETLQHLEDEKNTCEAKRANLTTTYNITLEEKDREITQLNNLTITSLEEKDQELSRLNETLQHLEDEKNTCEAKRANLTTTYNITLEEKDRKITQLEDENNICSVKLLKKIEEALGLGKKRRSPQLKLGSIPAQK